MQASSTHFARQGLAAAALALALPVWAQTFTPSGYQQERAACAAMSNPESRANCLRDLGAARQQQQRQPRARVSAEELQRNALRRCEVHKDAGERAICERMARGDGQVSGSVSGGGQIRSLETTVPGPAMPLGGSAPQGAPGAAPMGAPGSAPMNAPGSMPMNSPGSMPPAPPPPSTVPPLSTPPSPLPAPRS